MGDDNRVDTATTDLGAPQPEATQLTTANAVAFGVEDVHHDSLASMNTHFQVTSHQSKGVMGLARMQVFSPELCDAILDGLGPDWVEGSVATGSDDIFQTFEKNEEKRRVEMQRLPVDDNMFPLGLILRAAAELNSNYFHFDVRGIMQSDFPWMLRYSAGRSDFYVAHTDVGDSLSTRKLSFVIQMTEPDEYDGGELQFMQGPANVATEKGWMTVFPSYRVHQVTPVTRGVRHAIVGWIHGPAFR